jgi:hypothetical protein
MSVDVGRTGRSTRRAALAGVIGALGFLGTALAQAADPTLAVRWNVVAAIAAVLLVGTVAALSRSGAAGGGRPAGAGLVATALGWVTIAAALVVSLLRGEDATSLYIAATVLHFGGMVVAGVAVARAGVWTGWRRWAPLLCGVYVAAASPLFSLPGVPGFLAVAGWGACWLLLGIALVARR